MTNEFLLLALVVLCSLGGWYVVLNKYLEMKAMVKGKSNKYMQHIPGMGPPPLGNVPLNLPPEILQKIHGTPKKLTSEGAMVASTSTSTSTSTSNDQDLQKRTVCNWASIMHLSGLALVTGVPFVNIIIPAILWLIKKEQHPYLLKQGREVINFQITLTFIMFACLGLGAMFIWLFPSAAAGLFAYTRTVRIVFSTSMHMPFNLFTVLPFFWGCTMALKGAVASYNGMAFTYPYSQPFIIPSEPVIERKEPVAERKEPQLKSPLKSKITFG